MPFASAKLIDVAFDVVVGRGGQALVALILDKACTKALIRIMEKSSVAYGTYEAITLQPSSVWALWIMFRDFWENEGKRGRWTLLSVMTSTLYVLMFPTLTSAMTGYISTSMPLITLSDGSQRPWRDFSVLSMEIVDGQRLSKSFPQLVAGFRVGNFVYPTGNHTCDGVRSITDSDCWTGCSSPCTVLRQHCLYKAVLDYQDTYGWTPYHETSSFHCGAVEVYLDAPSLNFQPVAPHFGIGDTT